VLITKYTHSCVRLELDTGAVLVIDPGVWSEASALHGADAVLITHEHADHIDALRLAGLGAPVFAPAGADIDERFPLTRLAPGESFTAAGVQIRTYGGKHAPTHRNQPACANLGYLVDDRLYHPGDSLSPPDRPVETLLIPMQAAWLKTTEAIEFAQSVAAQRAFGIHDAQINQRGRDSINGWFTQELELGYRWLAPRESW
jgi:L-ascorbate metabolism protein UlaG (beta-lactamase superfamily)